MSGKAEEAAGREEMAAAFRQQGRACKALGSPFTEALLEGLAQDIDADGVVARVMAGRSGRYMADAAALRLAGALHAAVLTGRDAVLATHYPPNAWEMASLADAARAFITREFDWVKAFVESPPQTNETRRAIALLPAFLECAALGPLHMRELGASAGLNQHWEKFRFSGGDWTWGPPDGPPIDAEWRGARPRIEANVVVASRAGVDLNPLDVRSEADMLRLRCYIWPDQPERMARLDRAMALAQREGVAIEKNDAGAWLARTLAGDPPEGVTVLYHSIVWQYFSRETRAACEAAISAFAARTTPSRRFAWVRYEHEQALGGDGNGFIVDMRLWPENTHREVARAHPHTAWVELLE